MSQAPERVIHRKPRYRARREIDDFKNGRFTDDEAAYEDVDYRPR